jgi:peroxiredoxin Q/BCP
VGYRFGVGREAPVFTATAHDGNEFSLRQYRGDWLPVIVFVPAGSLEAVGQLSALSTAAGQLWGLRAQLVGILDGTIDQVKRLADEGDVSFPLIADSHGALAEKYGAWNAKQGKLQPLAYIIDRSGKIVWSAEGREALKPAVITAALVKTAR